VRFAVQLRPADPLVLVQLGLKRTRWAVIAPRPRAANGEAPRGEAGASSQPQRHQLAALEQTSRGDTARPDIEGTTS
jgi:hypothetical protein